MERRKRPAILTTTGVLNIVFGSLGLICGCLIGFVFGLLFSADINNPNEALRNLAAARELLQREIPSYQAIQIARCVFFIVFSSLLIAAGIGLLYIANWARVLSFIYASAAILTQGAYLLYTIMVELPAAARIEAQFPADPMQSRASEIGAFAGILFVIIYAIVLIILLCTPTARAAFSPRPPGQYDQDGYDHQRPYNEYGEYDQGR